MLQHLALETSAQAWVVASMFLFLTVFAVVAVRVLRTPRAQHEAHARLPLQDGEPSRDEGKER